MSEFTLVIRKKHVNKYRNGYPLILEEFLISVPDDLEDGDIINLVDDKDKFIAKGYYGRQNRGLGWILSRDSEEKINFNFFYNMINNASNKRKNLYEDKRTTAFRIFNNEGDGIGGMTIDYYDGYYVFSWYSEGIYKFRDRILGAFMNAIPFKGIYEKKRFAESGKYIEEDSFYCGEMAPEPLIIKENDVNYAVYLDDGAMVGIFLDQREVRKSLLEKYAKGKTVLNTFSYTGAFSIASAVGGSGKTTSVDLANRSLEKTEENFRINDINPEDHEIVVQDVFDYFTYAEKKNLKFDIVVLDPPSFAKSKKRTFTVAKDYTEIMTSAIKLTEKGGLIVASTNASNVSREKFKSFLDDACEASGVQYKIVEEFGLPSDFTVNKEHEGSAYLKVFILQIEG